MPGSGPTTNNNRRRRLLDDDDGKGEQRRAKKMKKKRPAEWMRTCTTINKRETGTTLPPAHELLEHFSKTMKRLFILCSPLLCSAWGFYYYYYVQKEAKNLRRTSTKGTTTTTANGAIDFQHQRDGIQILSLLDK